MWASQNSGKTRVSSEQGLTPGFPFLIRQSRDCHVANDEPAVHALPAFLCLARSQTPSMSSGRTGGLTLNSPIRFAFCLELCSVLPLTRHPQPWSSSLGSHNSHLTAKMGLSTDTLDAWIEKVGVASSWRSPAAGAQSFCPARAKHQNSWGFAAAKLQLDLAPTFPFFVVSLRPSLSFHFVCSSYACVCFSPPASPCAAGAEL